MRDRRDVYKVLVGEPEGRNHLENPSVDGRILLKWIFKKSSDRTWNGLIWIRRGTIGGLLYTW
jgi:hypothetical protein